VLLDVDRGEDVVLHETLAEDDRVLVVVALPGHERHEQVAPEGHLAVLRARTVGQDLALLDPLALVDDGFWLKGRALVGATELGHPVGVVGRVVVHDVIKVGRDLLHHAGLGGEMITSPASLAARYSMPVPTNGASERSSGTDWRCMLAPISARLASSCSRERDHGRADRHHLARRDVHVVDLVGRDELDLATLAAHQHPGLGEVAFGRQRRVGLRDDVLVLLVGGEVVDLVG
jgi:hypothetical protein